MTSRGSTNSCPRLSQALGSRQPPLEQCLTDGQYFVSGAASLASRCIKARHAMWRATELAHSVLTRAADARRLAITGRAGTGKTHLFCDVATRRIADGSPTHLLLGQDFGARNLLPQFAEITQLGGALEAVIASFAGARQRRPHHAWGQLVSRSARLRSQRSVRPSSKLSTAALLSRPAATTTRRLIPSPPSCANSLASSAPSTRPSGFQLVVAWMGAIERSPTDV